MLQYSDLTLQDVSYYWKNSILLLERHGDMIPCNIIEIDSDKNYPIQLGDLRTGERLIRLRLSTFVEKVLIHHPALGYGDYNGVPLLLSVRAGQEKRKGVSSNNLSVLCPIDWTGAAKARLTELQAKANALIDGGRTTLPRELTEEYARVRGSVNTQPQRARRAGDMWMPPSRKTNTGEIHIANQSTLAHIIYQCVNNKYPSLTQAMRTLQDKKIVGVSVSRDFALFNTAKDNIVDIYHGMAHVGCMIKPTGLHNIIYNKALSHYAKRAVGLAFERVRR